jgi:hypothetical protein
MPYDPSGSGTNADDVLVRRGKNWESARRLEALAAAAAQAGTATNGIAFGHGVSITSPNANDQLARDPEDCVTATRRALEEAGFEVRYTPTKNDADHHTVQLPKPVTDESAIAFNTVFGRLRK